MPKYLIDENLPYRFNLWKSIDFIHVYDIPEINSDNEIWDYAKNHDLIIVTKDSDFSNKIMSKTPPPKVIHIRFGNVKLQKLNEILDKLWPQIEEEVKVHKMVNVFIDRIESIS